MIYKSFFRIPIFRNWVRNSSADFTIYRNIPYFDFQITAIEPKWLHELAPSFFKISDNTKLSVFKKNQKIDPLFNKYEDANAWRLSRLKKKIYNPNR